MKWLIVLILFFQFNFPLEDWARWTEEEREERKIEKVEPFMDETGCIWIEMWKNIEGDTVYFTTECLEWVI